MRFFHLSDLHIGKQFHYYNLREDQESVLSQVVEAAGTYRPDAVVIAGDIYDKSVPSAEAVTIFNRFLTKLSEIEPAIPILIIAGNHDSAERLEYASEILGRHHIHIAGMPPETPEEQLKRVELMDAYGEVVFYLLPFTRPVHVQDMLEREELDTSKRNVIVSHQFYTAGGKEPERSDSESIVVGGLDNVDSSVLEPFDYAALGHIHKPQTIGSDSINYCGTLLKYSVSEWKDEKGLVLVELLEKGKPPLIQRIPLKPLRDVRKAKGTFAEMTGERTKEWRLDYISITITDEIEPYHLRERLEELFPYLLEVQVDNKRTRTQLADRAEVMDISDPAAVFARFFEEMQGREMTEEEEHIMRGIINETSKA